ncbi:armadillo-type protein [Aspergillus insuetus]
MPMDHPPQAVDVQVLINEARTLVSQLYDPANTGNPTKIKVIQEHLQTLQKGPHAWVIANSLLADESTDLRFFGALTFTVKVNHDWQQLSSDDARELIGRLIDHYVFLVNGGERPLVIRKLASSLATIFLKAGAPWTRAILSLGASLAGGKYISEENCQSITLQDAILPALAENQVISLLYFSNILAEEINRLGSESRRSDDVHRVSKNIKDAFLLVEFVLSQILQHDASNSGASNEVPGAVALDSYQSWIAVRSSFQLHDAITAAQLIPSTNCVIQSLSIPFLSRTAARILTEAMGWRDSMLTPEHLSAVLDYLISHSGTTHIASLMEGDFEDENIAFLELLLAFSSLRQMQLLTHPLDDKHEKLVALLHTLFKAPGYAAVDDSAAPLVLEWWTSAADDLQDNLPESEKHGIESAKQNLARVTLDCFEKLKYPIPEELREWNDDERAEFSSFRRDVCDFLLAIYPILGVELVHVFQAQARNSLTSQDWGTFEAAIFCVAQLSEAVDENQHADDCLNSIFFCDEFSRLCEGEGVMIPDKPRQTLVDMLGKYQSYFERTHALLPRVLTFLFSSLDVASCASTASKSIAHLCKSCRNALKFELPAFIGQFEQFRFKPTATTQTMEKVLEGIAAIIQILPSDEEKATFLGGILRFFHEQADLARNEAAQGSVEPAQNRGHMVLRCLASIGRGLRADGEVILDSGPGKDEDPYPPTFWNTGDGAVSQNLIMQCMRLLMTDFPFDVAMIEATCDILKAGFTESTGPYVFPPRMMVDFVKSIPLGTAGTDMVMGTASAFLASHGSHSHKVSDEAIALILRVYDTFCWVQEKPELYDPEIANSGIDFLTRLLPKYYPYLFALTYIPQGAEHRPPVIHAISNFTLLSLQGPEPIPLRSASQFWVSVLNLPTDAEAVQNTVRQCLPTLCRILITQVAGRCARSDLEHLTDVLRRVIFKQQGNARPHLTAALADIGNDHTGHGHAHVPSPEERQRFLSSLFAARGVRTQTLQLVRAFWVKCRGAGFDYIG